MHLPRLSTLLLPSFFLTAASADDAAKSYTDDATFKQSMLDATNDARKQHNASGLAWNETLAKYAEGWSGGCGFKHSGGPYGENLASGYANVSTAVGVWRDERDKYDYRAGKFSSSTGHFTQLVWKSTTQLGCARSNCTDKGDAPGWYIVCEYSPPGNFEGQFGENVQRQEGGSQGAGAGRMGDLSVGLEVVMGMVAVGMGVGMW